VVTERCGAHWCKNSEEKPVYELLRKTSNIECVVVHKVGYRGSHQWFIGEIKAVHLEEAYTRDEALMYWAGEYRRVGEVLAEL
jgi:flavin reductase (DIM6/NTAB) family NADH-FMN oxidoreductase RutF